MIKAVNLRSSGAIMEFITSTMLGVPQAGAKPIVVSVFFLQML